MNRGSREREVGMVRRREEDGPRRAAAIEGEENHYCQLRQVLDGGGEGVYSNVETDQGRSDGGDSSATLYHSATGSGVQDDPRQQEQPKESTKTARASQGRRGGRGGS